MASVKNRGILIGISKNLNWHNTRVTLGIEGQWLIVQGNMLGRNWTLVGIYAPQTARKDFFHQLLKDLVQLEAGNMVLMGDFIGVMDDKLDKSKSVTSYIGFPKEFKHWLYE